MHTEAARASFTTDVPLNAMYEYARTTLDRPLYSALLYPQVTKLLELDPLKRLTAAQVSAAQFRHHVGRV